LFEEHPIGFLAAAFDRHQKPRALLPVNFHIFGSPADLIPINQGVFIDG
jgi:hypothetical protein